MAHIEKRTGRGKPWRVRYRAPSGRERSSDGARRNSPGLLIEIPHPGSSFYPTVSSFIRDSRKAYATVTDRDLVWGGKGGCNR